MKLLYFELNLDPHILSQEMIDTKDIRWWNRDLANDSSYLMHYLQLKMNKEISFDCHRINLICTDQLLKKQVFKFDSVHEVDIPFDVKYFSFSPLEKQEYLFQTMIEGTKILCDLKGWDHSLWKKHLEELKANDFYVEHDFRGRKCRHESYTAKLIGIQTLTETTCYVDFYKGRKFLERTFLTKASPNTITSDLQVDRMEWIDDKTVAVYNYDNTEIHYATLEQKL